MIEKITIHRLFNSFDYEISFPKEGETMILTGPNGYGKTTILNIIKWLLDGDLLAFLGLPFESIKVRYSSGILTLVSYERLSHENEDLDVGDSLRRDLEATFEAIGEGESQIYNFGVFTATNTKVEEEPKKGEWNYKFPFSADNNLMSDKREKERKERCRKTLEETVETREQGTFLLMFNATQQPCRFIPSQRLFVIADDTTKSNIENVSDDFKTFLKDSYFKFLEESQTRDTSFIKTLLNGNQEISEEEYNTKAAHLRDLVEKAKDYDLLENFFLPSFKEDKTIILNYFVNEANEKLRILQKPLNELELFSHLINKKRMVNKKMVFSRKYGLQFKNTYNHLFIDLNKLSSGEKNEIIMLHDFIFNLEDGSILLIDEPEISLHVAWQHEFLDDLERIAIQKKLHVIVATHSPQIIGERWDECYDLKEVMEDW